MGGSYICIYFSTVSLCRPHLPRKGKAYTDPRNMYLKNGCKLYEHIYKRNSHQLRSQHHKLRASRKRKGEQTESKLRYTDSQKTNNSRNTNLILCTESSTASTVPLFLNFQKWQHISNEIYFPLSSIDKIHPPNLGRITKAQKA